MANSRWTVTRREFLKDVGLAGATTFGVATLVGAPVRTSAAAAGSPGQKFVLRYAHAQAPEPQFANHQIFGLRFQESLAKATNGAVEVQIFPANQLGEERAQVEGVRMGTIDMMASGSQVWGNFAPKTNLLSLPYIFTDYQQIRGLMFGPFGEEMDKHIEASTGARVLGWYPSFGHRNVSSRKEVKKIEDLKGMKIRVTSIPPYIKAMQLLGANPTPMAFGEVYTGLQTGVIDGWDGSAEIIVTQKTYEVTKYVAKTEHAHAICVVAINAKKLDSLPAEIKKAVVDTAKEAILYVNEIAPKKEQESFEFMKSKGMTINDFDKKPVLEKAKAYWTEYAKEIGATDILAKMTQ